MSKWINFILLFGLFVYVTSVYSISDQKAPLNWIDELGYEKSNVYKISYSDNVIPQIPVSINGKLLNIQFDTGNAGDVMFTTAVKNKIKYQFIKTDNTYNGDGSYRGEITRIRVDNLEVFHDKYYKINGVLADWRLFSSTKFNGNIGLNYFTGQRITLDYQNKKIALSRRAVPEIELKDKGYFIIPLLRPAKEFGDLLFAQGVVNGKKTIIYFDTGITPSHIDRNIAAGLNFTIDPKRMKGDFNKRFTDLNISIGDFNFIASKIFEHNIKMNTGFEEPVGVILGSDILKDLLITIDLPEHRLILKKMY